MGRGILGIVVILAVAWLVSEKRRAVKPWKVAAGLALQIAIAVLMLKVPGIRGWVQLANRGVQAVDAATTQASAFMFGYLGGGPLPFQETSPGASFIVAFRVLPLVLVMSAISAVLFYWGVLPAIVRAFAYVLRRTFGMSGAAGVGAAADVFLGIAEAPLFVRPYLKHMTRNELFTIMTCGIASVAGTVMVLYATVISQVVPDVAGHILVASVITIPAGILLAHLMVPEGEGPVSSDAEIPRTADSTMDALVRGTMDGVQMLLGIVALIVVLFALVHLTNAILAPYTLQGILGVVLRPVTWLIGIPGPELATASELLGTKIVLNEFVAFLQMGKLAPEALSAHTRLILTYALCGFANLASLGILIGGLTTMVPERKKEILGLGFRSLLSGNLATLMTGALMGLLA